MAVKEVKQVSSPLVKLPVTVATGDTVKNSTTGILTLVICVEKTVGTAKVISKKDGVDEIVVAPGKTSAAITLAAGEKVYALDTYGAMATTADLLSA